MKKLVFVMLLSCGMMQGQIGEVKETTPREIIGKAGNVTIQKTEQGETDIYSLSYVNAKYTHLRDFKIHSFFGNENDLETLYQFLRSQLDNEDFKSIEVGKGKISAAKSNNRVMVHITHDNRREGYFLVNKKELDKLFGKA